MPLRMLAASVRDQGLVATAGQLPRLLLAPLTLRRLKRRKLPELSRDGFDAAHGTDTAGVLVGRELGPAVTRSGHLVVHYETTSTAAIRMALDGLTIDFSRCVFVDLGCGKGKPLLVAASYPFRRLIGVDISPACIAIARRNFACYGPEKIDPSRVELLCRDVEDFEFPGDPMVLYLYNPFPGWVLEKVVERLEESLRQSPRPVVVVYVNPHALTAIGRSELFERIPTIADRMPLAAGEAPPHERAAVFVTRPAASGVTPAPPMHPCLGRRRPMEGPRRGG
jgi:SAM-dependent methyltransferase